MVSSPDAYAGLASVLSKQHPDVQAAYQSNEVEADFEGKSETLPDRDEDDQDNETEYEPLPTIMPSSSYAQMSQTVDGASKGVTDGTDREYRSYNTAWSQSYLFTRELSFDLAKAGNTKNDYHCHHERVDATPLTWMENQASVNAAPTPMPRRCGQQ
ncbi:hypothetical protein CPB83DRAFT_900246 [Crepidotus variabilis]|uniref:Uncharacterized protein n=1 Tax=Crepidotus variabilis TaxID=179855 RepID=A0A9P6JI73_9AGAR|nr:hypothetical protein CPB83DRAFT_900246 [Crepidotus variabilis]